MSHEGPGGFSQTPLWVVLRCRKDVWLYDYLRARYGGLDATYPGIKTIAKDFGISYSTVQRALVALVEAGAVEKRPRPPRADGGQSTNEYITYFTAPELRR